MWPWLCSTTGALGYYARELAHQGMICIVMAQSPEMVCPYGSYKPFFGTNPIAIGIPTGPRKEPVVFDMATSAIAYYGQSPRFAAARQPLTLCLLGCGQALWRLP